MTLDPRVWRWQSVYENNLKRIETVTKQIIEIEEKKEKKNLQSATQNKFSTVTEVTSRWVCCPGVDSDNRAPWDKKDET